MTSLESSVLQGIYSEHYKAVKEYATHLLGNIHHICTNDYSAKEGIILWTDHGVGHSKRIVEYLDKLVAFVPNLDEKDKFSLLCSAWLHDIGMFLRHPDFPDLATQRKYHGRVARSIIRYIAEIKHWNEELKILSIQVAEICELHQSRTRTFKKPSTPKANDLGSLFLLADGIDICKERVNGKGTEIIVKLLRDLSLTSIAEWWVNECIACPPELDISDKMLILNFYIDQNAIRQRAYKSDSSNSYSTDTLYKYLRHFICRYILKEHWGRIKKNRNFGLINNIEIIFHNRRSIKYNDKSRSKQIVSYNEYSPLWVDHLIDYDLSEIKNSLFEIKQDIADDIYIFVFDKVREVIRYLANPIYESLNKSYEKDIKEILRTLYDQKIPPKWGIIGHVFYCGLIERIKDLKSDPRRINQREDEILQLNSVMFCPLVKERRLWV